jgi:hypothetical protein
MQADAHYCSECGQKRIREEDHSVLHLIVESVGDFFHVDSKFFRTLRPLFFRPGFLTNEYLAGRRARYFHPFKLFLFISFIYFLTAGIVDHNKKDEADGKQPEKRSADTSGVIMKSGSLKLDLGDGYLDLLEIPEDSLRTLIKKYGINTLINIRYPDGSWYKKFLLRRMIKNRLDDSDTLFRNMDKTKPKLVFALIPFFAGLLSLLYIRRKIPYFNHVIFSFHFLSLFFLLQLATILFALLTTWMELLLMILLMVYLYFAILRVYHQKKLAAFGTFLLLVTGSLLILFGFFLTSLSISFLLL